MTESEKNEILESVRKQLTGDFKQDVLFLQKQAEHYTAQNQQEIANELVELAMNSMSQEQKAYMDQVLCIGSRRLDAVYGEARRLTKQNQTAKSLTLTKQLYEHIRENFKETETARFFSFHNLLESNLYYQLYHPTKNLLQAPFDLMLYLGLHAYNLVEVRRLDEAIPVLSEAIRYNPVCPDPRFELAEIYKLMGECKKLLETIKETLPLCTSSYALSRCYTNMGYYCTEIKDYDSAVAFYFESMIFCNHPAVRGELQNVSQLMGKKIAPPTREEVLAAFAKYEIPNGAGEEVMHTVTSLSDQAVEKKNWKDAVFFLHVICDLTNDPAAQELLNRCESRLEEENKNSSENSQNA
ncbi:MAG: hypothetical protein K2H82_04425 [Oscillospiraceae bacterium]|nr:hypothetical protein [Oscillospiraceae bacterium]